MNIDEYACQLAAEYGHLDCLKYLHETAKAPWDEDAVRCSARGKPNRMFTIPPRQQLSSPTQLAIRTRRVTRARIRIRIRIITHILNKAAAPSYYSSREKHRTHTYTSSTKISSLYTHTPYTKTRKRKSKRERRETKYERDLSRSASFCSLLASSRWCSALSNAQHDGHVRKFLRYTRGA